MREARLIEVRREGKHNYYHLLPTGFRRFLDLVFANIPQQDRRIRFEEYVLSYSPPESAAILRVDLATRKVDTVGMIKIPKVNMQMQQDDKGNIRMTSEVNPLPVIDDWAVLSDGSVAFVRSHFPGVRILPQTRNLGFAEANNLAERLARGEWVALLNNDTRVDPRWLEELLAAASDPTVGGVASRVLFRDEPRIEALARDLGDSIDRFELGNGLKVVLSEDHTAPVVALNIWYNVGSRNENPGSTTFVLLLPAKARHAGHDRLHVSASGSTTTKTLAVTLKA